MASILGPSSDWMGRYSCQPSKHILPILPMKPCMDFLFSFARWTIAKFPIFWGVWRVGTGAISHSNRALKIWKKSWIFFFLEIFDNFCSKCHETSWKSFPNTYFDFSSHKHKISPHDIAHSELFLGPTKLYSYWFSKMRGFYWNNGTMTSKWPQMDNNPTQCLGYAIYFDI